MAGNEQLIDSVVDPIARKQVQDLTTDLTELDGVVTDTILAINDLNKLTASSSTFSQLSKNTADLALKQEKLNNLQQQGILIQAKKDAIIKDSADKQVAILAKQAASEQKAADQKAKNDKTAIANSQAKISQLNKEYTAYERLNNSIALGEQKAREIGLAQGTSSKAYIEAANDVSKLRAEYDAINKPLGVFANNTERYTKGIADYAKQAFSGIRFLANVIPNFGIGTFFLLLGTGIAAVIEKLDLFTQKVSNSVAILKNYNDVNKTANQEAGQQITNLKVLYTAATDVNNNYRDRIRAAQELKKEFPGEFKNDSDLAIINGQLGDSYKLLTGNILQNAKARAAASKISELAAKQLDEDFLQQKITTANENEKANASKRTLDNTIAAFQFQQKQRGLSTVLTQEQLDNLKKINDAQLKANESAQSDKRAADSLKASNQRKKDLQDQIDFLTKFAGGNNKIAAALSGDQTGEEKGTKVDQKGAYNEQLKALKLAEDAILQNSEASYDQRLKAVDDYYNAAYDLTKKYSDKGVLNQIETNNKLTEFDNDTAKDRIDIQKKAQAELSKLINDGLKQQEVGERESIELIQKAGDDKILAQQQDAADAEQALAKQYSDGLIKQKDYQTKLTAIEDQADIDRLDQEIVTTNAIIDLRKGLLVFGIGSAKELQQAEDKLANLKLQRTKAGTKAVLDGIKDETQARKDQHQKEIELSYASLDLIKTVVDGGYQKQIDALDKVSEQIDVNATNEKNAVNSSLLSSKDKADKNAIIDAKAQKDKEAIAAKEKQLKIQQAEFDKALSVAKAIEATALAVTEALPNVFLAALVGALGAVQIATILATPLPQFKDGGVTGGGHILWGEAGTEMATLPDGSKQISQGPTIQSFPAGTLITPHMELMRMLKPDKIPYADRSEIGWQEVLAQLKRMDKPNKRPVMKVSINGDFEKYRKNYFK